MNNITLLKQIEDLREVERTCREKRQALEAELRERVYSKFMEENK